MKKLLMAILLVTLLAGCGFTRDVSTSEIRTEKYFHKSFHFEMPISEMNNALTIYEANCGSMDRISIYPDNPKKGYIIGYGPGWSAGNSSTWAILDFEENENKETNISSYFFFRHHAEKYLNSILPIFENPKKCL